MDDALDLVVIGGGAAGLTAAMFGGRLGLRTLVVDPMGAGGQVINAERIEDFPGLPQGIAGYELGPALQEQAEESGAEFLLAEVTGLLQRGDLWVVRTAEDNLRAKAVIVAAGSRLRSLGVPGEEDLLGRGVSHCAACDGPFYLDQPVGVVGGGDAALDEALVLSRYASRVTIFHRGPAFRAQKVLQARVLAETKVDVRWNTTVSGVLGRDAVTGVLLRDSATGSECEEKLAGLFIYVGLEPNTAFLAGTLALDAAGHIPVDAWMATEKPGLFAAGDLRQRSARLLAAAAGDGATAAVAAHRYVSAREWP